MRIKSAYLFSVGFIVSAIVIALLFLLLQRIDLSGGEWAVYGPGEATPHALNVDKGFTNIDLLIKLGSYTLGYWLFFSIVYFVIARLDRIRLDDKHVRLHFSLSVLGFLLIVLLNKHILFAPTNGSSFYLSNAYIGGNVSEIQIAEWNKIIIIRDSLINPSSVLGLLSLFIGVIVFAINFVKNLKRSSWDGKPVH